MFLKKFEISNEFVTLYSSQITMDRSVTKPLQNINA